MSDLKSKSGKTLCDVFSQEEIRESVLKLRNEVSCRVEHGAESGGHLEYVLKELDGILARSRSMR